MERNLEGSELRKKETTPPKEDYIMYERQKATNEVSIIFHALAGTLTASHWCTSCSLTC